MESPQVRVETLTRDDIKFLNEMLATRMREIDTSKLDPQEKEILRNRYRKINSKLAGRRFPIVSTSTENVYIVGDDNNPGHVIVLDGSIGHEVPSAEDNGTAFAVKALGNRVIENAKLVLINGGGGQIVVKDRYGVMK